MAAIHRRSTLLLRSVSCTSKGRRSYGVAAQTVADYEHWKTPLPALPDASGQRVGRGPHWVFLGSPGAGKGIYADRLAKLLGVPHISMRELLQREVARSTPLSKKIACAVNQGELVSDEVIIALLSRRLDQGAANGESGFMLDGFPRTRTQAEILDEFVGTDLAVNLTLRQDVSLMICLGRRICSECGRGFNLADVSFEKSLRGPRTFIPAIPPPPECISKLVTRGDDVESAIKERLRVHAEKSEPVVRFYRRRGKLLEFEVLGGIAETWPRFLAALELDDKEAARHQLAAGVRTTYRMRCRLIEREREREK